MSEEKKKDKNGEASKQIEGQCDRATFFYTRTTLQETTSGIPTLMQLPSNGNEKQNVPYLTHSHRPLITPLITA